MASCFQIVFIFIFVCIFFDSQLFVCVFFTIFPFFEFILKLINNVLQFSEFVYLFIYCFKLKLSNAKFPNN